MSTMKIEELFQHFADHPYITHENYKKCGQCYKEYIRSEVAKEFIKAEKNKTSEDLHAYEAEVKVRWQQTEIYQKVKMLEDAGHDLESALKVMESEGYLP